VLGSTWRGKEVSVVKRKKTQAGTTTLGKVNKSLSTLVL